MALNFFEQLLVNPIKTGALAPSSATLARTIASNARLPVKKCVVELGSGTGVFTKEISRCISPNCLFFSLEINENFVKETRNNCPDVIVYNASAGEIRRFLLLNNRDSCDCVISGLPWTLFSAELQEKILTSTYNSLENGGQFLAFAYVQSRIIPSGIRFEKLLNKKFRRVEKTKIIWKNVLPAFIYICEK